jgi:branched-chain amino acid transport system substrate-binding protein
MADYIADVLKPNCAFVLSDDTTYGKGLAQIGLKELQKKGVSTPSPDLGAIPKGDTGQTKDFSPFITKAKESGCSAMFYGGYSPESGPMRAQMNQQGLSDVTMVGGDGMEDQGFLDAAGSAGEGTIATCPCGDITKASGASQFVSEYRGKWNAEPTVYAGDYYDIARMYVDAFSAGKTTRDDLTNYFTTADYQGVSKEIRFQSNGELDPAFAKIYYWKDVNKKWTFLGLSTDVLPS